MSKLEIQLAFCGDIEMEYVCFGEGDRPLVVIPGLSLGRVLSAADSIAAAYSIFAKDFRVYLFERRKNMPDRYTINDMAEDTAAVIKQLGLKDIALYGVSQGGMISQLMAINYPELVWRLVLCSTISKASRIGLETRAQWTGDKSAKELYRSFAELVYSGPFIEKYGHLLDSVAEGISEEDMRRFRVQMAGSEGFSTYEELDKIKCPAFVIGAWSDRVIGPEASFEIAERLSCRLLMYPAPYAHAVYDEAPDIKERIYDFIKD